MFFQLISVVNFDFGAKSFWLRQRKPLDKDFNIIIAILFTVSLACNSKTVYS